MSDLNAFGQPKLKDADLAASYGWALAVLNSDKQLKKLFKTAVKKQYSADRFRAEVMQTQWFQKQSDSQRKYQIMRTTDPSKYISTVNQIAASLADQWGELTGQRLTYNAASLKHVSLKTGKGKKGKSTKTFQAQNGSGFLFNVADTALKLGWNEAQIKDYLGKSVNWSKAVKTKTLNDFGGSISANLQQWRAQAHALGLNLSDGWYAHHLRNVSSGNDTQEGVLGAMKKMAKQRYSAFADDIEAGASMDELTANYKQSIAKVLEIPDAQVDVFDKNVQKAVNHTDEHGNRIAMNIGDFEDMLRKDNRWQYTQNAKDNVMGTGMNVLKSFGLVS